MKKGNLITLDRYVGEEAFYKMHDAFNQLLSPEDSGYSVDSMCIGGFLKKDGILLRTSSECPYDTCCFFYNEDELNEQGKEKVMSWIEQIVDRLQADRNERTTNIR